LCGRFSFNVTQGIKWVLEQQNPENDRDVSVVFFDKPCFPKKALLLLKINLAKKQVDVKNYVASVLDNNFSLSINEFSNTTKLDGNENKISFWFPQADVVILVLLYFCDNFIL